MPISDPANFWADIERQEREAILRELEQEARRTAALPVPHRTVLDTVREPMALAFAAVMGILCGLVAVLAIIVIKFYLV
jgi:hypothetical protein